jgi:hypothetical protein
MRCREKRNFLAGAGVRVRIGGGAILPSQTLRTRHVLSCAEVVAFSTVALLHVSTEEGLCFLILCFERSRDGSSVAPSPSVVTFVFIFQASDVRSSFAPGRIATTFRSDINRSSLALDRIVQIDFRFPRRRAGRSLPPVAHLGSSARR